MRETPTTDINNASNTNTNNSNRNRIENNTITAIATTFLTTKKQQKNHAVIATNTATAIQRATASHLERDDLRPWSDSVRLWVVWVVSGHDSCENKGSAKKLATFQLHQTQKTQKTIATKLVSTRCYIAQQLHALQNKPGQVRSQQPQQQRQRQQ